MLRCSPVLRLVFGVPLVPPWNLTRPRRSTRGLGEFLAQMRFSLRVLDFYLSESFAMNTYENFVLDIVNIDNMKKQQENNNKKQHKNNSKKSQPLRTGTRRWF